MPDLKQRQPDFSHSGWSKDGARLNNGKPLVRVGLFDGPPADRAQLMPRDGGYDVPDNPLSLNLPNFTQRCTYRGSKDVLTAVLPRRIRVCDFTNGPQVSCH